MSHRIAACRLKGVFVAAAASLLLIPVIASPGGEIAELYKKSVRTVEADTRKQLDRFQALDNPTHGVTEVGMERTACHGTCPVYSVVFKADGTLRYVGEENVPSKGAFTGKISVYQFNRLAEFVVESGYMNLDSNYDLPMVADFPSTYTTAAVGGRRKFVRNYGDLGPVKLWALQQTIDSLLAEAEWDVEQPSSTVPPKDKP